VYDIFDTKSVPKNSVSTLCLVDSFYILKGAVYRDHLVGEGSREGA